MKINHAGVLSKDYFLSYFNLILATRTSDVKEAKEILFESFFQGNKDQLGKETYQNLVKAYKEFAA